MERGKEDSGMIELLKEKLQAQLVQTHASWVLIGKDFVYKIKKPVNFGFLDYSTLQKRLHYCLKEVELNRRMCQQIYIGVVPISQVEGEYTLEDEQNIVEYAVKMKKIPQERLLSHLLALDKVQEEDIRALAKHVFDFHQRAQKRPEFGKVHVMKFNTDENFQQTEEFIGVTLSKDEYEFIRDKTEEFYLKHGHVLEERAQKGLVVDGHGDIRLEHVAFLDDGVCVFDCIEFNDRFRCADVVNDMCFFSMELDFLGKTDLSRVYEEEYKNLSEDPTFDIVLPFFKSYRAYVRGKVYSFMLKDPMVEDKEKYTQLAKRMFKLSREYLENSL